MSLYENGVVITTYWGQNDKRLTFLAMGATFVNEERQVCGQDCNLKLTCITEVAEIGSSHVQTIYYSAQISYTDLAVSAPCKQNFTGSICL